MAIRRFLDALLLAALGARSRAFESGYAVRSSASGELTWASGRGTGVAPLGALAYAHFADNIATEGFARLLVQTLSEVKDDRLLFEAMGFVEGYLTAERTVQHMHNTMSPAAPEMEEFVLDHNVYLRNKANRYRESDPYWKVVDFLLEKQRGFASGMRLRLAEVQPEVLSAGSPRRPLAAQEVRLLGLSDTMLQAELMRLNMLVDVDEIMRALEYSSSGNVSTAAANIAKEARAGAGKYGHCSALVTIAGPRVLLSHNTWSPFNRMMRIWKDYSFPHVKFQGLASRRISIPSYPGYFASNDDWLVIPDTKMVVLETTLDAYDTEKLAKYISPASVTTMMRSIIASLLATRPREWYETFSRENSGSQNNQWMVFSSSAWAAASVMGHKHSLAKDIFWVLEQQPGQIVGRDMTETLLEAGYWGSWNVARFNETLATNQYLDHRDAQCKCEGQRGALMDELHGSIKTLVDLQTAMRTNTWRSSPLSWMCPKCAIAARFDLPGANETVGCFSPAFYGAIDAKVTDDLMAARGESMFVSGPPNIEVPSFSWESAASTTPGVSMLPHVGLPDGPLEYPWRLVGGYSEHVSRSQDADTITLFM
eukprot:TRINITY_DN60902_c0_g1_i1.p1 TRINITY_DN60902_c0_g1~~TRINITY_DN60902_c0_g1_i1.p1  ORF type:complete len:596 (+),score=66.71 TRINITY_DN60902_c0_g1_i1:42-1829(+)